VFGCGVLCPGTGGNISKAMKNMLVMEEKRLAENDHVEEVGENEEEYEHKMRNIKVKSVSELRNIFNPKYTANSRESFKLHPTPPCLLSSNEPMWDSIGEDREWDLVLVDNHPMEKRTSTAARLLKRTKVLIIHDTEDFNIHNPLKLPQDFIESNGAFWNGHPCFTDISDKAKITLGHLPGLGDYMKPIWTTLIRGDLDKDGKVFDSIVKSFKDDFDDVNAGYRFYNNENAAYGTHARLLLVAAMMTHGDILELGMGDHSTQLLHDILEEDNKSEKRMLVSAESDLEWLESYKSLVSPFHQILHVESCQEMHSN